MRSLISEGGELDEGEGAHAPAGRSIAHSRVDRGIVERYAQIVFAGIEHDQPAGAFLFAHALGHAGALEKLGGVGAARIVARGKTESTAAARDEDDPAMQVRPAPATGELHADQTADASDWAFR